ncbi:class I adenylate-forming enzyme family protein [Hydrogenophaga sp.]|uniref:class I adenylate-forming enzyme family protein n=1 Tax=Hydrogenophaga sp. TaxID=1904254 RepID=UPI003D0C46C4
MTVDPVQNPEAGFEPFPDIIRRHAGNAGDTAAFVCDGVALSWRELARDMARVASACGTLGVGEGDKVALLATVSLRALTAFFGAIDATACAVPLTTSATPASVLSMLRDSDARVLLASADQRDTLAQIEDALHEEFRGRLVALDFEAPGWIAWHDWLAAGASAPAAPHRVSREEHDFNIIYSSGTTGSPKGILHRHGMRHRQAARRSFGLSPQSVMLLSTPLYSNTTLQPLLATLAAGGTTLLMPRFSAQGFLQLCTQNRVTHTMLVPVQYQRLLDHPDFAATDLSSFQLKQCTGAPLDAGLIERIQRQWPGQLREIYGMTEGGCSCVLNADEHPDKLGTVGKPAPHHDMRIIDEAGRELPTGEAGEIVGRSPYMMAGYYKRPDATAAFYWRDATGAVFHRSGDIGRFDADGFLTLLDRKKDMIISGGFNVYAADLETILATHPDVADAAVIGIPSAQWGETPLALVVPRTGAHTREEELLAWTNAQVGKTQRLSAVEYRPTLPRSALGKVLKRDLRAPYWAASSA